MELVVPAFIAGVFTFLAPCTLPLLPGYLSFIGGVSGEGQRARRKVFLNGLFFVIGFSVVFILLGVLAGVLGAALVSYRIWLTRIGGVFVIIFGLFMLQVFDLPFLNQDRHFRPPSVFQRGKFLNSFILGAAFAFGWTPCVGPILGSVLLIASTTATAAQGALLLAVFSLGLGIPFLLVAGWLASAQKVLSKLNRTLRVLSIIGGLFLIGVGILLLLDQMGLLLSYGFRILEIFNYEEFIYRFL